jgi:hypothetical protein
MIRFSEDEVALEPALDARAVAALFVSPRQTVVAYAKSSSA